jgi:hypothetical protein
MNNAIVTFLWAGPNLSRRAFSFEHVETFGRMVHRHSPWLRIICLHDGLPGNGHDVEWMQMPSAAARLGDLRSPEGVRFPSCYRRLWLFSPEAGDVLCADNVLLLDIDLVVLKDLTPLFDYVENFVGWLPLRDWGKHRRIGGGIYLLKPGTRTAVWDDFKGAPSIAEAHSAGYKGSDQAWISYKLASNAVIYPKDSGIYSIRDLKAPYRLPADARLVQFNGPIKQWQSDLQWVKDNWK